MNNHVQLRLAELRKEFEAGQQLLGDLSVRQQNVQQTLLRIGGAIQVLEELLTAESPNDQYTTSVELPRETQVAVG
jgi:hypothetical protein